MPKITEKNVFRNPKYVNILKVIDAYGGSLEFKHIAYILIGKEKLRERCYISSKTVEEIPKYLEKHKIRDYNNLIQLNEDDTIKNPERLSECLSKLRDLGLIEKVGKKYRVNTYAKHLCWIIGDTVILERRADALRLGKYREGHSPTAYMDSQIHIFSKDPSINAMLKGKYREKFDKVVKDLKEVLSELDRIRREILSNELEGYSAREFAELTKHYDWFIDDMYSSESNISVVMNTFEGIAESHSPVSQRLISRY